MKKIKISLITVTYNAADTLQKCISSVKAQSYSEIEYIIIDGNSNDETCKIIKANLDSVSIFISEADEGIYDAINKGIRLAEGEVIGLLNADDYFAYDDVIKEVAEIFELTSIDILYADLNYRNKKGKVTRKWHSGLCSNIKFNFGWMPPHPTFYAKKECFNAYGLYKLNYGTAADYELMLRFMYKKPVKVFYVNKVIVNMTTGGVSNRNFVNRFNAWKNDFKAMRTHRLLIPILSIALKPLRKIAQFYI